MLSSDGGATFTSANTGLSTTDVGGCIAVNPQNPQMLLIADAAGLAISTDGGNTWTETASQTTCPFSVHAKANPFIVYALGTNGAVKSTDFGETWTALNIRANVVADPSTANSAFAVGGEGGSWSPDAGTTWYSLLTNGWGESSLEPGGFEGLRSMGVWRGHDDCAEQSPGHVCCELDKLPLELRGWPLTKRLRADAQPSP